MTTSHDALIADAVQEGKAEAEAERAQLQSTQGEACPPRGLPALQIAGTQTMCNRLCVPQGCLLCLRCGALMTNWKVGLYSRLNAKLRQ